MGLRPPSLLKWKTERVGLPENNHVFKDLDFLSMSAFLIKYPLNTRKPCYSSFPQIICLLYICKDCQLLFFFLEVWQNRDLGERKTDTIQRNPPPITKKSRPVSSVYANHPPLSQCIVLQNHYLCYWYYSEEAQYRWIKCKLRFLAQK